MHDLKIGEDVLQAQERRASRVRAELRERNIRAFNVMGAIGSGKTTLIERIIERLGEEIRFAAIAGDVAGDVDYQRYNQMGIPAVNLNTQHRCHLDAHLVEHALAKLPLDELEVLWVENVGNLVCPADFPLGAERSVVVISVTEGDDMIRKHPKIFAQTDLVVVNKVDLAEFVEVDPEGIMDDYRRINPHGAILLTAAKRGEGISALIEEMELGRHA